MITSWCCLRCQEYGHREDYCDKIQNIADGNSTAGMVLIQIVAKEVVEREAYFASQATFNVFDSFFK